MASREVARNGRMANVDRLLALFRAFRERNEEAFFRAADAIIADELAANHHSQARELQRALSVNGGEERPLPRPVNGLAVLPKDRRFGEPLVALSSPDLDPNKVVLVQETRQQVERVIQEHAQRQKLLKHGYLPKSKILFWGPPGCGKTLTAALIASELRLPLGVVRLSTLITSFLGETASHIQRIFDMAQSTPMVLLIDEADAIAKDRDDRNDVGELKRVVNSLLQAMDSFQSAESVVIAASNHQYLLDSALWRRFDDVVFFPLPKYDQVKAFLSRLLNGIVVTGNLEPAARATASLSFAQIESCVIEALKAMILDDRQELCPADLAKGFKKYKQLIRNARHRSPSKPIK
jgi:SpoVK/Ycf46/Vps4 family AAA+-type ATPase